MSVDSDFRVKLAGFVKPRLHDTAGCQTGCQTSLSNKFDNRVEQTDCSFNTVVKPVVQPGLTTGCIHDTAVCQTGRQMGLTTG